MNQHPASLCNRWLQTRNRGLAVNMEAQVNMLHVLSQLQKKLQLDLKTNNTQDLQNIKLYGSLTTKDYRSHIHPDGQEEWRGVETWCGAETVEWVVPHSHVVDKNWEGYLRRTGSQHQAKPHCLDFQCQEDKSP